MLAAILFRHPTPEDCTRRSQDAQRGSENRSKRAAPRAYLDLPRANIHGSLTCPATLESVELPHRLYFSVDSITIEWPHGAYIRTAQSLDRDSSLDLLRLSCFVLGTYKDRVKSQASNLKKYRLVDSWSSHYTSIDLFSSHSLPPSHRFIYLVRSRSPMGTCHLNFSFIFPSVQQNSLPR